MSSNIQNAMTVLLICILIFGLNWSSNQFGSVHQDITIQVGKRPKPNYLKKSEDKSDAYKEERVLSKWNNYSDSIQRICTNHSNYPSIPHFYIDTQHKLSYCKVPKVDNPKKVIFQIIYFPSQQRSSIIPLGGLHNSLGYILSTDGGSWSHK